MPLHNTTPVFLSAPALDGYIAMLLSLIGGALMLAMRKTRARGRERAHGWWQQMFPHG